MIPKQETGLTLDCDTLLDLIPEYAFGLMDAEETRRVEGSLRLCPDAAARLDEYRHIQEEMRAAVPQIEPSTQLGLKLMAALNTPAVSAAAPSVVKPAAPQAKLRRTFRTAWLVALAAVIALILTNVYWLTRVGNLTQSPNLMTTLLSTGQNNTFVVANTDALHWVRLASNTQTTQSTQPSPTAQPNQAVQTAAAAFMMWNSQSKIGLLYARNFPALKPGEIYHLWLTNGDKLAFGGVFQVDTQGDGALIFTSSEPIDDFTWARITAQSPQNSTGVPTGEPVVIGQLS